MDTKIAQLVRDLFDIDVDVKLSRPESQFGDYSTNVALQIAGRLGKPPHEIADELAKKLRNHEDFAEVTVAGIGFINIFLDDKTLLKQLEPPDKYGGRLGQVVVIETNNPNPFKAMHIGHAFNAVIGDTIANLLAVDGARVHRVSYHGDVGLHVGKSMRSILRYIDGDINKLDIIPEAERNTFMSRMYTEGSKAYKEDENAKAEIDDFARESFSPQSDIYRQVYELCMAWSFEKIDYIVTLLGNQPVERRFLESEADGLGVDTVKANVPEVFSESKGALIFEGSKYGSFDNVFVASNGNGLYGARDLGLMQLKNEAFHAEKSYIVTAEEQRDYFKGVIAAAELSLPLLSGVTMNISTGTVKLSTGKMSSRDGDVVEISWLFDEFKKAIVERGGEPTDEIVSGALRYQFLKVKLGSDVVFDVDEAVSLQGNTGSYLQYAHARARSILKNTVFTQDELIDVRPEDRLLVRKMGEYSEIIELTVRTLEPHRICSYLFELAQEFNRYYEKNRVIGSEHETNRAGLVARYAHILGNGLAILGIAAPEKM